MVGGWSFNRSKFNRAMQAYRQLGSTFKPIVYTAAIDRGLTPATLIVDQPVSYPAGSGELYEPQNYDHKFEGPVTLRRALEQSRNIPAIKMMEEVGPPTVVSYAKRFGFSREFPPYLPIALGAGEGTLLEVTSAYSVFPNRGVRARPYFIQSVTDRQGNLLEEGRIDQVNVIRADTAFMMTSLLEGVVRRGTAEVGVEHRVAARGQDGHRRREHRRLVHRVRPRHHRRRLDRTRRQEVDRRERDRRGRGAADLDGLHEGVRGRAKRSANLRRTREHRVSGGGSRDGHGGAQPHGGRPSPRRSSPAPSQAGSTPSRNPRPDQVPR